VLVGTIHSEEKHPISRVLMRSTSRWCAWSLRWKWLVIAGALALVAVTVPVFQKLGSEFMPPLDEGALLFMPTTLPGISVAEAQRLMQAQDRILMRFPEVERVLGKAGRAETSTDPAPFSMMETMISLKPKSQWRKVATWYDNWPQWTKAPAAAHITPDHISTDQLVTEMNEALRIPGVSNAWTMPIKNRIDMLTTGIRTPVGIKIYGADLAHRAHRQGDRARAAAGGRHAQRLRRARGRRLLPGFRPQARPACALRPERGRRADGGHERHRRREREHHRRGPRALPHQRALLPRFRSSLASLGRALVPAMDGKMQIPLAQIATLKLVTGPAMLRNENGMLNGYVYVDVAGRDIGGYVAEAKRVVRENVQLPPGYTLAWSGQYEAMERVRERLKVVLPLTLFLIFLLLYLNTKSTAKTMLILLAVPFSAVGAIWLLYLLGYNMSIGVWVGLIALMGVDAETGVFMLLYLDLAYEERRLAGRMRSLADLQEAIVHGAVKRIRPKFMTVATMFVGLAPIMWSTGAGADVMKRIAAPMIGGIFTSFILELVVYPAIYEVWKWHSVKRQVA
jgi:Cu(I)/Ag(I) efflux system membrane protein CusA/SilA